MCVLLTCTDVAGFMHWWGLTIDITSMNVLIIRFMCRFLCSYCAWISNRSWHKRGESTSHDGKHCPCSAQWWFFNPVSSLPPYNLQVPCCHVLLQNIFHDLYLWSLSWIDSSSNSSLYDWASDEDML